MRLVAFGCSFTWGEGLSDVWNKETGKHIRNKHSKLAWPQLLADKLNVKCINNGIPGASNKEIWWKIINFDFIENDIVVIFWTIKDRITIFKTSKEYIRIRPWNSPRTFDKSPLFYKHFYEEFDATIDAYFRKDHVEKILNLKSILNFHETIPNIVGEHNLDFALDNTHPGPKSHEAFATKLYNEIKNEKPEKFN